MQLQLFKFNSQHIYYCLYYKSIATDLLLPNATYFYKNLLNKHIHTSAKQHGLNQLTLEIRRQNEQKSVGKSGPTDVLLLRLDSINNRPG